jgi:hypothetical protein
MSVSFVAFTYYLSPLIAYSQTESSSGHLYTSIVTSTSKGQQQTQQPQSKVIEAIGHFANNLIEDASVSWIQGGLWHLGVYNSSSSSSSPNSAKATFSANFTM